VESLMVDLARWLGQQLDEDEQIARTATERQPYDEWDAVGAGDHDDVARSYWEVVKIARMAQSPAARALAIHIAAHDPARVLREIDAKRRIIRAHAKWCQGDCEAKYPDGGFDAAHYWSLKALAAVYADRPGYREEWSP
jgi:hypothetical protein